MKNSTIGKAISTHIFVLRLAWDICRKRVLLEFLYYFYYFAEFLLADWVLIQLLLSMAAEKVTYFKVMVTLWSIILIFILGYLIKHYYEDYVQPVTDVSLYKGIQRLLYQKACRVDLRCFEDSDFYNQYMMAIRQAQVQLPGVLRNVCKLASGFAAAVAGFWLVFSVDHYAVLFLIFPVIGNFVFNRILIRRVFRMDREILAFQRIADYVNRTIHLSDYAKEMRLSNIFRLMKKQYERSVASTCRTVDRYAVKNIILYGLMQVFTFTLLFESATVYAGYRVLVSGTMTFAQMAVFQSIMCSNTWLFLGFTEDLMECVKSSLGVEQIQGFLNYEPKIPEDAGGELPQLPIRSIEFSHVWFGYKEGAYILKDISFRVVPGQSVAIAGYNGAGKSTLIKLLLRLYEPDKGTILLNGRDIRSYNLKAYRALFAAAFQDGKIFADTIQENILMGRRTKPEQDRQIVWEALELAGMAEEVSSWPKKEHTILTREFEKEGFVLSGGQCQKIVAARAFAKDSPVAVFDEPSSALDPLAEFTLFQNIQSYSRGKILFFISHRLSSVRDADLVLFMENGRIIERGNHRELMEKGGSYAELYKIQAKNYLASEHKYQEPKV